jgi:hypothetical protein
MNWSTGNRIKFIDVVGARIFCNPRQLSIGVYSNELECASGAIIKVNGVTALDMKLKWEAFKAGTSQTNNAGDPSITIFQ